MANTDKNFPRVHVGDPGVYSDDEEPTRPNGMAARSAMLVSDWSACEPEQQAFLERTARRLADIVRKRKAPIPNGRY